MKIRYNYGNIVKKIISFVLFLLYIFIMITNARMSNSGQATTFLGASIQGVLTVFQFLIAFVMVTLDYGFGGTLAIIGTSITSISTLMVMIRTESLVSLPGTLNGIGCLLTVFFMRSQFAKDRKEALTDLLTGISNKKHIHQYIDHLCFSKTHFYVLLLEIEKLQAINDALGYEKCDKFLKNIVDEWKTIDKDSVVLGRFSGSEFLSIINVDKCPDVGALAKQYIQKLEDLVERYGNEYSPVHLSIGIIQSPKDANETEELLRKAHITVLEARTKGSNQVAFYDIAFEEELLREQYIETRISKALKNEEFYMVYQPQYKTMSKKLRGFESLIRMESKGEESLFPGDFIPVAEKSDLIIEIGEYVVKRVLNDFKDVVKKNDNLVVSVNISAKQLLSDGFVDAVKKALDDTGFPPKCLEIEITEYCIMDTDNNSVEVVNELKKLGIQFAMDDFGTGYSSLSYLSKLPLDLIKIDKSLVDDMKKGEIIEAISSMAHALSCEVIAEGVEDEPQLEILRSKNCDLIQGFIWGKPMRYEEALELCDNA